MRGTIVIDENRCKGCELCTFVCPKHLISIADIFNARGYRPALLIDPSAECTGCLLCAVICPDVAITVYRAPKLSPAPRPLSSNPLNAVSTPTTKNA